jgi:hypothetical protein
MSLLFAKWGACLSFVSDEEMMGGSIKALLRLCYVDVKALVRLY